MFKDVVALAGDERADPELRRLAAKIRDDARKHRLQPVGIHVMRADGELLAKLSVNDAMTSRASMQSAYREALAEGLEAHRRRTESRPGTRTAGSRPSR